MKKGIVLALLLTVFHVTPSYAQCVGAITDPELCETREILFETGEAVALKEKAQELGSVVNIYEYVRNNAKYTVYHGARSNSLNAFLSLEGNDVDLASTLIAMFRSVGVKSRYAVGNVKLKQSEIANWLGVTNESLAVSIMQNQGINIVDNTAGNVIFEHVWVEALVNFSNYRGGNDVIDPCSEENDQCKWVSLDPSFKLHKYNNTHRTILENVNFDYNAYYHAEGDQKLRDKSPLEIYEEQALEYLRDNHPGITLEDVIDEGEIVREELGLLPSSLPYDLNGGSIFFDSVKEHDESTQTAYGWTKYVFVKVTPWINEALCDGSTGASLTIGTPSNPSSEQSDPPITVADLSTKRLTLDYHYEGAGSGFRFRLDGVPTGGYLSGGIWLNCGNGYGNINDTTEFDVDITIDSSPIGEPIKVRYENLMLGGYYLIATGGETSNWSQVERAYKKLLSDRLSYPLDTYFDTPSNKEIVYVDYNNNGSYDAGDTHFLEDQVAQDALTGGILYVAQSLYYARLREESNRYSRLKNIVSPISAYVGIISSTYEAEVVDETPFALLPGGLLIDLKGIRLNGSWEADQPESYSNETFKFLGHIASSLEHEVWQELTGYDAISTMRGIQYALADGASLLDVHNTSLANLTEMNIPGAEDNFEEILLGQGYSHVPPAGFKKVEYPDVFGRNMVAWKYDTSPYVPTNGMVVIKGSLRGLTPASADSAGGSFTIINTNNTIQGFDKAEEKITDLLPALKTRSYYLGAPNDLVIDSVSVSAGFSVSYESIDQHIRFKVKETISHNGETVSITLSVKVVGVPMQTFDLSFDSSDKYWFTCDESFGYVVAEYALPIVEDCFNNKWGNGRAAQFFDRNEGYDPNTYFYKTADLGARDHDPQTMTNLSNGLYFTSSPYWRNYTIPSEITVGPFYAFNVYINDLYRDSSLVTDYDETSGLVSSSYIIENKSFRAGGGYVPEQLPVEPATDIEGVVGSGETLDTTGVMFNNEVFTDQNLVAISNNDVVMTPSTVDPVSTVTGNMYHDETDFVIPGKGLPYTFTRTYNSNETTTDGPLSPNPDYLPMSQGWTHSYNMKLVANDHGQYPNYDVSLAPENENNQTSSITYLDERGGESNYLLDDGNPSAQPTSPYAAFSDLTLNSPSAGLHTINFNNGISYTFDSQGADMRVPGTVARLHSIVDAYGNSLSFAYTNNQLTGVTDNIGQSQRTGLTLQYYTSGENLGRLQYVSDWTGRQWEYFYASGKLSAVSNPLGHQMAYTYVGDTHLLKDIIHPQDRAGKQKTMTFSYYANGQAYNYVDQNGSAESLIYDTYRRRTRVTNPRGLMMEHYYDQNGALIKLVEPNDAILLFKNSADGLRYEKFNALGQRTRYSYHTNRNLDGNYYPSGEGYKSDTDGKVTREEDALGNTIDYDYGIHGQVTLVKDKNGNSLTNIFYASNNATTGAVAGKLHKQIAAKLTINGAVYNNVTLVEYKYHIDGTVKEKIEYIDPAQATRKRITTYTYVYNSDGTYTVTQNVSGSGKTLTVVQSFDALWRLRISTAYRRASATDATQVALTTTYDYDGMGRVTKVTDPIGNIKQTIFDANGKVYQQIVRYKLLPTGNSPKHDECTVDAAYPNHHSCILMTNEYDAADRLIKSTDIFGAITQYQYDPMGNVTKVTNHLGNSLSYEYDGKGNRTRVTDEKGYSVKTKYDLAGKVLEITDANDNSIKYSYDVLGRKTSATSPEGRVSRVDEYDKNGNAIRVTDANGVAGTQPLNTQNASVYSVFDEFNRLVSTLNANNEQTRYTYDLLGNRTSITDANNQTTTFVYDDLGHHIRTVDPIIEAGTDKVVEFTYDEMGNRLTYTDRLGETTRYSYDNLNRLVTEEYLTDAIVAEREYDQYGDMVMTSYGSHSYTYTYDAAHRLLTKTDSRENRTMSWKYDDIGNLIKKTNYQGEIQGFVYNKSNRLVSMSARVSVDDPVYIQASYHYDPAGRLLSRILSNGAATLYNYTPDGFISSIKQYGADGTLIDERVYETDEIGNIELLTANGEVIDYSYDPAYRLLTADSSNNANDLAYTYDSVGNRRTKAQGGNVHHYIYNNNGNRLDEVRLNSDTGTLVYDFDYDDNGSMIAKYNNVGEQLLQIDYDQRRLAKVMGVNNQPNTLAFQYDANAYRIGKDSAAKKNRYYLESEHLESVYDDQGELQAKYLRGAVVDEIINGFEINYGEVMDNRTFHHDLVNSVVALSDHNGNTVQQLSYGPFGEDFGVTGTSHNYMWYTGREQDAESGLYYYRARYYDPELGRFVSEDPIGFGGGINFFAYVSNNPLFYNDPMGMDAYTLGLSARIPIIGVGVDIGAFTAGLPFIPETTPENFDVGVHGSFSLGILPDVFDYFFDDGTKPDFSTGVDFGKLTIDAGVQWAGSDALDGVNYDVFAGAGSYGGTLNFDVYGNNNPNLPSDSFPTGTTISVGPQLRAGGEMNFSGSVSVGDAFTGIYSAIDWATDGSLSGTNQSASNGGFVIYPSKLNNNMMNVVYEK